MEINNVNATPAMTGAQTKTVDKPIENKQKKEVDPNGNKKIIAGLTALGAIALAGIGLYKHNKKATQQSSELLEKAAKEAQEQAIKAEALARQAQSEKIAKKIAEESEKYNKVPSKSAKESAQAMQELWAKENSQNVMDTASLAIKNKGLKQGIQSQNLDDLIATIDTANANAKTAQELADKASDYAKFNPTKQNIRRATIAQNKASQAQIEAKEIASKADKRFEELVQKEAHQNAQKASPNYEAGLAKQKLHQAVTDENAVTRKASKKTQKTAYQRAVTDFQRRHISDSKEGLERVINSNKFSETEKKVAKDLLDAMK